MKKILLSGFEAFDEHKDNSSQIMVELFSKSQLKGIELKTVILPVTFSSSFEVLKKEIDSFKPDFIVSLGLAGNRKAIELEKVAINLIHTRGTDNEGVSLQDKTIEEGGETGIFATLPIAQMREVVAPFPVKMSFSAGTYVCNFLMYKTLSYTKGSTMKAGFIHLPHISDDQEEMFATLSSILRSLTDA